MLIFEDRIPAQYRSAFTAKVIAQSTAQQYDPNWIMAVMNSESGFNASIVNSIGCVGLIQFCPDYGGGTYKTLGGNKVQLSYLKSLDPVSQLDYVFEYYKPLKNKITRFHDLYMATFYPVAMGKPDDFVIGSEVSPSRVALIASQNPAIDINKDGKITVAEFREFSLKKVPAEYRDQFTEQGLGPVVDAEKFAKRNWVPLTGLAVALALFAGYLYFKPAT